MLKKAEKPENVQPAAKRKLTRAERKQIEAIIRQAKGDGKPHTVQRAVEMLTMLSGRAHQVMTGVTILRDGKAETFTEVTELHFRPLTEKEILRYAESGEPLDKAGAYGIQGGAALFCQRMEGDYYNVMGLPVCRLGQALKKMVPEWEAEA